MDLLNKYKLLFLENYDRIVDWKSLDRRISTKLSTEDIELESMYRNTLYIKYDDMISKVKCMINKLDKNAKYYILFPEHGHLKMGSENFIILECFDALKELNIQGVITDIEDNVDIDIDATLLIIDDAIYTGKHIAWKINTFADMFRYFISITYASNKFGEDYVRKTTNLDVKFISYEYPLSIIDICVNNLMNSNKNIDNDIYNARCHYLKILGDDGNIPMIYFDHKLHNSLVKLYPHDLFINIPNRLPASYVEDIFTKLYN